MPATTRSQTSSQAPAERPQTPVTPSPVATPASNDGPRAKKGKGKGSGFLNRVTSAITAFSPKKSKRQPRDAPPNLDEPAPSSISPGRSQEASSALSGSSNLSGSEPELRQEPTVLTPPSSPHRDNNAPLLAYPTHLRVRLPRPQEEFLWWFTFLKRSGLSETETSLFWMSLVEFFQHNGIWNGSAIDLNQKMQHTQTQPDLDPKIIDESNRYEIMENFVTKDHNRPDWVLLYNAIEFAKAYLQARICMVFEAKPSGAWGTAMKQIIVYMMKARATDGCGMGMIVAGSQYRIFFWDETDLWMAVPSIWKGNLRYTWPKLVELYDKHDQIEWDVLEQGNWGEYAKRNVWHILTHLQGQVDAVIAGHRRGSEELYLNGRPALEHAKYVKIEEVWANYPGSDYPPTDGVPVGTIVEEETSAAVERTQPKRRGKQKDPKDSSQAGKPGPTDQGRTARNDGLPLGLSASDRATREVFSHRMRAYRQRLLQTRVDTWLGAKPPSLVRTLSSASSEQLATPVGSHVILPNNTKQAVPDTALSTLEDYGT
ncbi:hypothetical protein FFLO_06598 [Filobasidium floriforme]|uniref:Uncharacterized protein n=1 Tax=Filobasidium floriforme TaxID=5210 RepID=A0A8K0NM01_9TREE|nr:hypothetical protein FFLO_06598 [Filobasidium floriforme]